MKGLWLRTENILTFLLLCMMFIVQNNSSVVHSSLIIPSLSKWMESYCSRLVAILTAVYFYASVVFFLVWRQHWKLGACVQFWNSPPFTNLLWSTCSLFWALKCQLECLIWRLCCQLLVWLLQTHIKLFSFVQT